MIGAGGTSRRRFLAGAAGMVGGGIVAMTARDLLVMPAGAAAPQPPINPRSAWAAADLKPKGPLPAERPEDVKFLLVHHTAGANGYPPDAVRSILRGIFGYHTGPKGWNDVAYNFFVDAHGGIWEGRQGSLASPVKGDATGGSQGFAQLCCFMGDHQTTPPSAAALSSMAGLLAWLAGVYKVDLRAGATATFVSRGSNLHPAGKQVTTSTIAAHREMSKTSCPGDACYKLVKGQIFQAAAKAGAPGPTTTTPSAPGGPSTDPASATSVVPSGPETQQSTLPAASPTQVGPDDPPEPSTTAVPPAGLPIGNTTADRGGSSSPGRLVGAGGASAVVALAGAAIVVRKRRARVNAESRWYSSDLLNPPMPDPLPPPEPGPDPGPSRP